MEGNIKDVPFRHLAFILLVSVVSVTYRPEGKFVDLFDKLSPRPDTALRVILIEAATYQKRSTNFNRHLYIYGTPVSDVNKRELKFTKYS